MSVTFIVDSASDILPEEAKHLGVYHVPMKVVFGDTTYQDGVDLTHRAFFEMLAQSKTLPTTCQIPPAQFEEVFAEATANGDEAVVITISSHFSGTWQSAMIAAQEFPGKIHVVDSLSLAMGERILLMRGLELAKEGLSAGEIAAALDREKEKLRVIAMLDTLEYLKRGGRISAATALAGSVLSIKPAVEVKDGKVIMSGKARGARQANELLGNLIRQYGGVNFEKPWALVYSGLDDDRLQKFLLEQAQLWQGREEFPIYSLGSAIGTHIGPGAYGIAFFEA